MRQLIVFAMSFVIFGPVAAEEDPAEITLGERIFLETRFAQASVVNKGKELDKDQLRAIRAKDAPFTGQTMSCRACHLVDEQADKKDAGMRTYADFSQRPAVPARQDGATHSPRHSQQLVNIRIDEKENLLFHFDGEFASLTDLVMGTYTGRNLGWLPGEKNKAIKHIAAVIRNDDGKDELGKEFGGSYATLMSDKNLPAQYRVDVKTASDSELFTTAAKLVAAYVSSLAYSRNEKNEYNGSPYDKFLKLNELPRNPAKGESDLDYSRRLLKAVNKIDKPIFVSSQHGKFMSHDQEYRFGDMELAGMKVFFTESAGKKPGKAGNCIACHSAPHFSDYNFHNTGVSQSEYDSVHGDGSFMKLDVPGASERNKNPLAYLPASHGRPSATGKFRSIPVKNKPGFADLGAWNVVLNTDIPKPQTTFRKLFCERGNTCSDEDLLNRAFAAFKTPVLRDLGHSSPYLHNGSASDIEYAIQHYIENTALAKSGILRNPAKQLETISITPADIAPLSAFIRALNEDYE